MDPKRMYFLIPSPWNLLGPNPGQFTSGFASQLAGGDFSTPSQFAGYRSPRLRPLLDNCQIETIQLHWKGMAWQANEHHKRAAEREGVFW